PGTSLDYEQAAVGVFHDIGGMKVRVVGGQEVVIEGTESSAHAFYDVALDSMRIELRTEQIAFEFASEDGTAVDLQAGGCNTGELGHRGHQVAGAFVLIHDRSDFGIHATLDVVQQRVALAHPGVGVIGHGADHLAGGSEHHLDAIIVAAADNRFQSAAIGTETEDATAGSFERSAL